MSESRSLVPLPVTSRVGVGKLDFDSNSWCLDWNSRAKGEGKSISHRSTVLTREGARMLLLLDIRKENWEVSEAWRENGPP